MRHGRRGYRRAFYAGLAISLVVHVILIAWISGILRIPPLTYEPRSPRPASFEGLRVVALETPPSPAPEREPPEAEAETEPPEPEQAEQAEREAPEDEAAAEAEEPEAAGDELTNAERLRPREGDPRLWEEVEEPLRPRGPEALTARGERALREILRVYLDSLELTEEQRRRARDWTFGEGDERWGISPEGLHLGDITIPLPLGQLLQPEGPRRRELERELRDRGLIERQRALQEVREVLEERREEMRRRSRERAEESESSDTTSSDPP